MPATQPMPSMQNVLAPIANLYQTQLEASRQFADAIFSGTEKIDQVMLDATHRAVTEQLRFAQSLTAVRDAQGMANAQSTYFSQRPDRALDYQRELMRIFTEMQTEIGRSMRTCMEQLSSSAVNGSAASLDAAEDRANEMFNPITGMFSVWESALREAASIANKNMASARNTFGNAVEDAFESANEAAENMTDAVSRAERKAHGKRKSS